MKNRFLLITILSSLCAVQVKAHQSQVATEVTNLKKDVADWGKNNPEHVGALGLGAVSGGTASSLKLLSKSPLKWRALKGAVMGAVVCDITYSVTKNYGIQSKKNKNKAQEVACNAGITAAALFALIFG